MNISMSDIRAQLVVLQALAEGGTTDPAELHVMKLGLIAQMDQVADNITRELAE